MKFDKNKSFKEIHDDLINHLLEDASVTFSNKGTADIFIPQNGYSSWWFDELVKVILIKGGLSEDEINLINNHHKD